MTPANNHALDNKHRTHVLPPLLASPPITTRWTTLVGLPPSVAPTRVYSGNLPSAKFQLRPAIPEVFTSENFVIWLHGWSETSQVAINMNLRYIAIGLDRDIYDNAYSYDFRLRTRFISNYLSKEIRKIKYVTDGSFNMISVRLSNRVIITAIVPLEVLCVNIMFDKDSYERIKGTEDYNYYLELFDQGFRKASEFKPIPLTELQYLLAEFKKGGCKNEWLHKKKKFKEEDIEVVLICKFTTAYFHLDITINQISSKVELVNGTVLSTEPNEILYEKMFKDILVVNNKIIITDAADYHRITIKKDRALQKILSFKINGETQIREMLSYGLDID